MVLKENVYGWYPPAKSRWTKPTKLGIPSGYDADCLYKHWKSRFNSEQPGVATPVPPSPIRMDLSSRSSKHSYKVERSPSTLHKSSIKVPKFHTPSPAYLEAALVSPTSKTDRVPPKPTKAWAMKTTATPLTVTPAPAIKPVITSPSPPPTTSHQHVTDSKRISRIHSAPIHRQQQPQVPTRPVKSAGPVRASSTAIEDLKLTLQAPQNDEKCEAAIRKTPIDMADPQLDDEEDLLALLPSPEPYVTADWTDVLDYDTELKKHGWKMEIPGDPLGLKAPCIKPRLSYTKKSAIPRVAPNPPRGHMQVYDTYFYNTIPRKPLSFAVHPEWVSEVLLAKRIALQKRDGLNFKHTNYSFAY